MAGRSPRKCKGCTYLTKRYRDPRLQKCPEHREPFNLDEVISLSSDSDESAPRVQPNEKPVFVKSEQGVHAPARSTRGLVEENKSGPGLQAQPRLNSGPRSMHEQAGLLGGATKNLVHSNSCAPGLHNQHSNEKSKFLSSRMCKPPKPTKVLREPEVISLSSSSPCEKSPTTIQVQSLPKQQLRSLVPYRPPTLDSPPRVVLTPPKSKQLPR
jgi:hypothetical protein